VKDVTVVWALDLDQLNLEQATKLQDASDREKSPGGGSQENDPSQNGLSTITGGHDGRRGSQVENGNGAGEVEQVEQGSNIRSIQRDARSTSTFSLPSIPQSLTSEDVVVEEGKNSKVIQVSKSNTIKRGVEGINDSAIVSRWTRNGGAQRASETPASAASSRRRSRQTKTPVASIDGAKATELENETLTK
jgi:hypothetical protein